MKFLHMRINLFSTYPIDEIDNTYQVWLRPDDDMIVKKRGVGEMRRCFTLCDITAIMVAGYGDQI